MIFAEDSVAKGMWRRDTLLDTQRIAQPPCPNLSQKQCARTRLAFCFWLFGTVRNLVCTPNRHKMRLQRLVKPVVPEINTSRKRISLWQARQISTLCS